jgi:hypothetical protein
VNGDWDDYVEDDPGPRDFGYDLDGSMVWNRALGITPEEWRRARAVAAAEEMGVDFRAVPREYPRLSEEG